MQIQASSFVKTPITPAAQGAPKAPTSGGLQRSTYDAKSSEMPAGGLGTLVRGEGAAPTGDKAVDAAHDNAGLVYEFYKTVLGRDSIDDKGMPLVSVVHFGAKYNNAFWDGSKMTYGDGDGKVLSPLSGSLDVVAHEMSHGVTEHTAQLDYVAQPGALNESWSDVFGELVEQWAANREGFGSVDAAKGADWLIGEDIFTPTIPGDALRSMKAPGTAHPKDPQPGHMDDYKQMPNDEANDNGGVHINSGIPNKAAYEAGIRIGSEKLAKVWYAALTDGLSSGSTFDDAAKVTVAAAAKLYDTETSQAVSDAWKSVGILAPVGGEKPAPKAAPSGNAGAAHHHGGAIPTWLLDGRIDAGELPTAG